MPFTSAYPGPPVFASQVPQPNSLRCHRPGTCLLERFGDYLYDNARQLPQTIWDSTVISRIDAAPLHLCDLSKRQREAPSPVDLAALMNADLSVPNNGAWHSNHPSQVPAIKFKSRFH